ncbi:putative mucin TcMUCII [Trypanosoma cruzi]|uniref:Mucin TcMUCII, putative n=2 Tax=Trypanosoma cruzi TaxID=5693 RepID=Q4DN55_TRYCC|nr:mucin TcMUCII, putative [Trypanosoma cruzi]EAN93959.1 mucin TcMUCII, putative [Trypanosoma cruzi]PWV14074.1 putative mucin TcMUCII [Trypanosoma cruzi]|eukprot:XP_815810.1 mucin TcMUCII [Trypanosoma cruzi strain CL Brener]
MMMTCRLLCALLLLALCCCPSVCGADAEAVVSPSITTTATTIHPTDAEPGGKVHLSGSSSPASLKSDPALSSSGPPGPPEMGSGEKQIRGDGDGNTPTATGPKSKQTSNAAPAEGKKSKTSGMDTPVEKAEKNAEDSSTTTTTTKPPTTTTTTTTQAPSTTTTEAPAVSTTRAPSRLREIDGSLSGSAWVCAPLVLAASALAYTTVG